MSYFLLLELFPALINFASVVYEVMTFSLRDLATDFGVDIPMDLVFLDYSLIGVFIGSGFVLFVGYTLVKWLLDIIF